MEKKKELTKRQKAFADEYLISLNGYNAALKAGYSKECAGSIASRNLKNPLIKDYMNKVLSKTKSDDVADIKEVMEYLTSVMRREEMEDVVVTYKEEKVDYKEVEPGEFKQVKEKTETPKVVQIPTKLSYAMKAAELLGKRYGVFKDEEDKEVNRTIKVTLTD